MFTELKPISSDPHQDFTYSHTNFICVAIIDIISGPKTQKSKLPSVKTYLVCHFFSYSSQILFFDKISYGPQMVCTDSLELLCTRNKTSSNLAFKKMSFCWALHPL